MTKPTKWFVRPAKTQISLGIRPVWSVSSLSAWRKLGSLATHWAHSEDFDQTGRMPRLIRVFAGRTDHFVGFVMRRLNYETLCYKMRSHVKCLNNSLSLFYQTPKWYKTDKEEKSGFTVQNPTQTTNNQFKCFLWKEFYYSCPFECDLRNGFHLFLAKKTKQTITTENGSHCYHALMLCFTQHALIKIFGSVYDHLWQILIFVIYHLDFYPTYSFGMRGRRFLSAGCQYCFTYIVGADFRRRTIFSAFSPLLTVGLVSLAASIGV